MILQPGLGPIPIQEYMKRKELYKRQGQLIKEILSLQDSYWEKKLELHRDLAEVNFEIDNG